MQDIALLGVHLIGTAMLIMAALAFVTQMYHVALFLGILGWAVCTGCQSIK